MAPRRKPVEPKSLDRYAMILKKFFEANRDKLDLPFASKAVFKIAVGDGGLVEVDHTFGNRRLRILEGSELEPKHYKALGRISREHPDFKKLISYVSRKQNPLVSPEVLAKLLDIEEKRIHTWINILNGHLYELRLKFDPAWDPKVPETENQDNYSFFVLG